MIDDISDEGKKAIKFFEGFRALPYKDTGGLYTVGYGHRIRNGETTGAITPVEANTFLDNDCARAISAINNMVTYNKLNQPQYDALVSFVYNLGALALKESTLLKMLNNGEVDGAANEFPRWCHVDGKVVDGLVNRRKAEQTMFNYGLYPQKS